MFAYYDGIKWNENFSGDALKQLANSGIIKPDTIIRLNSGDVISANELKALKFAENSVVESIAPTIQQIQGKSHIMQILKYLAIAAFIACIMFIIGMLSMVREQEAIGFFVAAMLCVAYISFYWFVLIIRYFLHLLKTVENKK
jgi:hypothetical protein